MANRITIPRWFDRHLHLRSGEMLKNVLPWTLGSRAWGAVIMGNLAAPHHTWNISNAIAYKIEIESLLKPEDDFQVVMTCYLTDEITPEEVVSGYRINAWRAVKLYMAKQDGSGGTTNSAHGVKNLRGRYAVFAAMERYGIPLLGHFEAVEDDVDEFEREFFSLHRDLIPLREAFPKLIIVVEHVSDHRMAEYVAYEDNGPTYATVTAHHLLENRNALFKDGMNPLHWCKPVIKREVDRRVIRNLVTSGHPRFGAGTDSAPHPKHTKMRVTGCNAGIFNAPCAAELYATVFDEENALGDDRFGNFMSRNLLHLYGLDPSLETMTFKRTPYVVPEMVGDVYVYKGGQTVPWSIVTD